MKKIFTAFVAIACALTGCSDEATIPAEPPRADEIVLSSDVIVKNMEGGTEEITVSSTGDWRLAGLCDWVHPSAVSGSDGDTVTFTVDPTDVEADRETTFKFFTGSAVASIRVKSLVGDLLAVVSEPSVTIEQGTTEFIVKLHTNLPELACTFSDGGEGWITLRETIDAFGQTLMRFGTTVNTGFDSRSCTLTVSDARGGGSSVEIPVKQRQVYVLEAKQNAYELDLEEQTIVVDISANVPYTIRYSGNWIQQLPDTRGVSDSQLRFRIGKATEMRSGTITLVNNYNTGVTCEIKVIQNDPSIKNVRIPDAVFSQWLLDKKWVVHVSGDEYTVTPAGAAATTLNNDSPFSDLYKFSSMEGIEGLTALKSISVFGNMVTRLDISKLTEVSSVNVNFNGISDIYLGDNPVESISVTFHYHMAGYSNTVSPETMTVSGSQLKTLDISSTYADKLHTLDVSGCPALETLKANRSAGKLKTIRLKKGQTIPNMSYTAGAVIEYVD